MLHTLPAHRLRFGVTLVEALIAIAILGILVGALAPVVSRQVSHARVNDAAQVLTAQLEQAIAVAARQRRPVRITVNGPQRLLVLTDRASGTVISQHAFGAQSDFKLESLSASPASIDILPQGFATSAATFAVGIGSYSRQVTVSRSGLVRLQP